ncbi:hypothetical protein AcW1_010251 [Taiwanofungus camphoratus]|nr:hypothetical protein AcW1_010251 [Antrodia cinnamomea]
MTITTTALITRANSIMVLPEHPSNDDRGRDSSASLTPTKHTSSEGLSCIVIMISSTHEHGWGVAYGNEFEADHSSAYRTYDRHKHDWQCLSQVQLECVLRSPSPSRTAPRRPAYGRMACTPIAVAKFQPGSSTGPAQFRSQSRSTVDRLGREPSWSSECGIPGRLTSAGGRTSGSVSRACRTRCWTWCGTTCACARPCWISRETLRHRGVAHGSGHWRGRSMRISRVARTGPH